MPQLQSKSFRHNNKREEVVPERITDGKHNYQIGAEIGRGGFAVVFQAFNVELGDFNAVKRFPLHAIDDESLSQIEAEIELMKKLNHPNIVKYVDTIRTDDYLYIVLEYMENGSLLTVFKKFGSFSESLAAIYIVQVLKGLKYLHEQGVLHRDIKGANILTTKDGQVKLADFGVAMNLSDGARDDCEQENDVVGTPYWMAPEVIEMSTPTAACDIWSVGCTIIELLTGKPPYFDLAPMAALFRIVQDDYPPLPEGISQALRDFLMLCFQKEPVMRKTAEKLLEHPWLHLHTSSTIGGDSPDLLPHMGMNEHSNASSEDSHVIAKTIKFFRDDNVNAASRNDAPTHKSSPQTHKPPPVPKLALDKAPTKGNQSIAEFTKLLKSGTGEGPASLEDVDLDADWESQMDEQEQRSQADDNAPLSSREGSSLTKSSPRLQMSEPKHHKPLTSGRRAHRNGNSAPVPPVTVAGGIVSSLSKYQETDEDNFMEDDFCGFDESSSFPKTSSNVHESDSSSKLSHIGSSGSVKSSKDSKASQQSLQIKLKQPSTEVEGTDTFDEFLNYQFDEHDFQQNETRDVHIRRSREILQLMAAIKPDSSEKDVVEMCDQLLVMFDKHPEQREHLITHHGVLPVLDMLEARSGLRPNIPVLDMLEARSGAVRPHVLRVINKIVEGSTRAQEQLSLVGLIPIVMRLLEHTPNPKLKFGMLTSKVPTEVDPVVLEAARFVHQISSTSSLTLQMLIGAGGLPVLMHMVAFCYQMGPRPKLSTLSAEGKELAFKARDEATQMVFMGIDCIIQVFSVQSSRTRDFCKLFVKLGLLPYLKVAFQHVMGLGTNKNSSKSSLNSSGSRSSTPRGDSPAEESAFFHGDGDVAEAEQCKYGHKIATIFWIFSRYEVAEQMAEEGVLDVIVTALQASGLTDPVEKFRHLYDRRGDSGNLSMEYIDIVELLLKCIKNLSMEPTALVALEQSGAIGTLIPLLDGPIRERCKNHVMPCLFNLCRINKRRQELAALEGIIPHLQRLINEESHLRQFALPIICDLAHTSATARAELWKNNGVVLYINLLQEKYWQTFALNSLAVWLANDRQKVEALLVESSSVMKIAAFFRSATTQTINTIHKPLLDMMSKSHGLSRALGTSGVYVSAILKRLHISEAIVLRSLLKMLQFIHQHHFYPRQLVLDHNMYCIVRLFALEEGQVLVNQMANRLLRDFQTSTLS
mmetsp:Transcript_18777/g.31303  ORF Transcript_18777/g.31303 Transcript_18777/m.31303 type:complete len:1208 (+) Transcript_18777:214-3837(+)